MLCAKSMACRQNTLASIRGICPTAAPMVSCRFFNGPPNAPSDSFGARLLVFMLAFPTEESDLLAAVAPTPCRLRSAACARLILPPRGAGIRAARLLLGRFGFFSGDMLLAGYGHCCRLLSFFRAVSSFRLTNHPQST